MHSLTGASLEVPHIGCSMEINHQSRGEGQDGKSAIDELQVLYTSKHCSVVRDFRVLGRKLVTLHAKNHRPRARFKHVPRNMEIHSILQ